MAIFSPGVLVGGISGAIGGVTFVNGRSSNVVRHRPGPRAPRSAFQAIARADLNRWTIAWSALTDAQRAAWTTAAADENTTNALGQSSPMTGRQFFLQVNIELHTDTASGHDEPLVLGRSNVPRSVQFTFSASGALRFGANPPIPSGTGTFFLFAYPSFARTKPTSTRPLVFLEKLVGSSVFSDQRTNIEAHWGAPVEGQFYLCGIAAFRATLYRSPIVAEVITVAA